MKKVILPFALMLVLGACGGSQTGSEATEQTEVATEEVAVEATETVEMDSVATEVAAEADSAASM